MRVVRFTCCIGLTCFVFSPGSLAAPVTSGNILISADGLLGGTIHEYTPGGVFVQSFAPEYPVDPRPATEGARDLALKLGQTDVYLFNGTFDPYLSTLDSTNSTWSHQTFPGWSTGNNTSFGGVAIGGQYVFVTDMATAGDPEQGIIRFDTAGGSPIRFATSLDPIDVNVGLNGLVYAMENSTVYVFDPDTLALQQTIDLTTTLGGSDYRAVAANAAGQMFVVNWNGDLEKTDASGFSLGSVDLFVLGHTTTNSLMDVDVSSSGTVVVGDATGGVTVTDEDFATFTTFSAGTFGAFVAMASDTPNDVPLSPIATFTLAGTVAIVSLVTLRRMHACRVS